MKEMVANENAFRLLTQIALNPDRQPTKEETDFILSHLNPLLRNRFNCWFSMWTPSDVIEYAHDVDEGFKLDYDRAKQICHDLESYDHIYSEVSDAVRNEIVTLRNQGYGE